MQFYNNNIEISSAHCLKAKIVWSRAFLYDNFYKLFMTRAYNPSEYRLTTDTFNVTERADYIKGSVASRSLNATQGNFKIAWFVLV